MAKRDALRRRQPETEPVPVWLMMVMRHTPPPAQPSVADGEEGPGPTVKNGTARAFRLRASCFRVPVRFATWRGTGKIWDSLVREPFQHTKNCAQWPAQSKPCTPLCISRQPILQIPPALGSSKLEAKPRLLWWELSKPQGPLVGKDGRGLPNRRVRSSILEGGLNAAQQNVRAAAAFQGPC